jgi:HK97 gp10 family phage protein
MSLKGLDEYLEALAKAGRDVDAVAKKALEAGAKIMQERMIALVPVDTGNLQDHIKIKGPIQDGNRIYVEVGIIHDRNYTDAETARYANSVEYGNSSMAAQPFIRPAIEGGKSAALREMKTVLLQELLA